MKKIPLTLQRLLGAAFLALLITILAASGVLYYPDSAVGDHMYQRPGQPDPRIVLVGVDQYALDEFGKWPWPRDIMADLLNTLNADPETRPAAIGVDILYNITSRIREDDALIEAASADNVVVAAAVQFGRDVVFTPDGEPVLNRFGVACDTLPFPELRRSARYGHINAMNDADGVLRHHLWSVTATDGEEILSMPWELYRLYCRETGLSPSFDPPRTDQGFWWVDFAGRPGDYRCYSAADILGGDYDPDILSGSIVLIGPYDPGLQDRYITAADRAESMYGVEYLANVLDAMLRGESKRTVSLPVQLFLLFTVSFVIGYLCFCMNFISAVTLCVSALALLITALKLLYRSGLILRPLWIPLGIAIVLLGSVVDQYVRARLEQRRIMKTFERHEDPAIIRELLRTGIREEDLNGQTREVAVLFVDIRGFTSLSERLPPESVVSILNEYLTLTSRAIKSRGGTLDKFIGDCAMAFWGAPLPCEARASEPATISIAARQAW